MVTETKAEAKARAKERILTRAKESTKERIKARRASVERSATHVEAQITLPHSVHIRTTDKLPA